MTSTFYSIAYLTGLAGLISGRSILEMFLSGLDLESCQSTWPHEVRRKHFNTRPAPVKIY